MVYDTPPFPDATTHEIWDSYLKEYRRYALVSMQILETRSNVKVNVKYNEMGWYTTIYLPKSHPHTECGIPTLNYIKDMLRT